MKGLAPHAQFIRNLMELKNVILKSPKFSVKWAKLFSFFPYDFFNGKRHPNIVKMQITVTTCGWHWQPDNFNTATSITSSLSSEGLGVLKFILGTGEMFLKFWNLFYHDAVDCEFQQKKLGRWSQIRLTGLVIWTNRPVLSRQYSSLNEEKGHNT